MRRALETLNAELGIERLLLEGGGLVNGSFLRAGLVDEVSLILWPAIDGASGAPGIFHSADEEADGPAPVGAMRLIGSDVLADGDVWLRYRLQA